MGRRAAAHGARRNLSLIYCLTQGVQSNPHGEVSDGNTLEEFLHHRAPSLDVAMGLFSCAGSPAVPHQGLHGPAGQYEYLTDSYFSEHARVG